MLFFFFFFTLSFSIFYLAERMPARGWLRERLLASRFGRFVSDSTRGAHLVQAAFENSNVFVDCCEQPLRAAMPVGPGALLTPARGRGTKMSLRLWGCVCETGRTARPASAWAAAAMTEVKDTRSVPFYTRERRRTW